MLDHNRTVPLRGGLWAGMLGAGLWALWVCRAVELLSLAIRSGRSRILPVRASSGSKGLPGQRTLSSCCSFRAGENLKEFPGTGGTTDLPGRTCAAGVQRPRIVDARNSLADLPGLEAVIPGHRRSRRHVGLSWHRILSPSATLSSARAWGRRRSRPGCLTSAPMEQIRPIVTEGFWLIVAFMERR